MGNAVTKSRVLILDIETAPILAWCWGLFDQNMGVNQIKSDWRLLAWAAKWEGEKEVMYRDQRNAGNVEDDLGLLAPLWALLDAADVVVGQNSRQFDIKKINARFAIHGLRPPSPYKQIDTKELAKKNFGFTSNKLEYLSEKLCKKYKKLKHEKFSGFDLWKACLAGDKAAWREMERYNKHDVLSTEELYQKLAPWGNQVNFHLLDGNCACGSSQLERRGFSYTAVGKFQRYQCKKCGHWTKDGKNLNPASAMTKRGAT